MLRLQETPTNISVYMVPHEILKPTFYAIDLQAVNRHGLRETDGGKVMESFSLRR